MHCHSGLGAFDAPGSDHPCIHRAPQNGSCGDDSSGRIVLTCGTIEFQQADEKRPIGELIRDSIERWEWQIK
jgi:hypothetical protein